MGKSKLEKILLFSFLASVPFLACEKKEEKESSDYQPRQRTSTSQHYKPSQKTGEIDRLIDEYFTALNNNDREGFLDCFTKRAVNDPFCSMRVYWDNILKYPQHKKEMISKKLLAKKSSKNRAIYKTFEKNLTFDGMIYKEKQHMYYYLIKKEDGWKIDYYCLDLYKEWLEIGGPLCVQSL